MSKPEKNAGGFSNREIGTVFKKMGPCRGERKFSRKAMPPMTFCDWGGKVSNCSLTQDRIGIALFARAAKRKSNIWRSGSFPVFSREETLMRESSDIGLLPSHREQLGEQGNESAYVLILF